MTTKCLKLALGLKLTTSRNQQQYKLYARQITFKLTCPNQTAPAHCFRICDTSPFCHTRSFKSHFAVRMMRDTVIKTQTQIEIEQMKAQLALVLAHINKTTEKSAEAEAIERAI